MLLKDYVLLNLGRITPAEANAWQADMAARRRVDACRDLLAFWRPRSEEGEFRPGQVVAAPILSLARFMEDLAPAEVQQGLIQAAREALTTLGAALDATGLSAGGRRLGSVAVESAGRVATGTVVLEINSEPGMDAISLARLVGREVDPGAVANAVAYHFVQVFGFAQASKHPVAYEESMRPKLGGG